MSASPLLRATSLSGDLELPTVPESSASSCAQLPSTAPESFDDVLLGLDADRPRTRRCVSDELPWATRLLFRTALLLPPEQPWLRSYMWFNHRMIFYFFPMMIAANLVLHPPQHGAASVVWAFVRSASFVLTSALYFLCRWFMQPHAADPMAKAKPRLIDQSRALDGIGFNASELEGVRREPLRFADVVASPFFGSVRAHLETAGPWIGGCALFVVCGYLGGLVGFFAGSSHTSWSPLPWAILVFTSALLAGLQSILAIPSVWAVSIMLCSLAMSELSYLERRLLQILADEDDRVLERAVCAIRASQLSIDRISRTYRDLILIGLAYSASLLATIILVSIFSGTTTGAATTAEDVVYWCTILSTFVGCATAVATAAPIHVRYKALVRRMHFVCPPANSRCSTQDLAALRTVLQASRLYIVAAGVTIDMRLLGSSLLAMASAVLVGLSRLIFDSD